MISVFEAQNLIRRHVTALAPEPVSYLHAHGRVLRESVASAEDLPAFDRSAMDGYAVLHDDKADDFEIIGEIRAGDFIDREIKPGQALRIFTGARLPGAGLKVVMQEHVEAQVGKIRIVKRIPEVHVRHRGEDALAGEILLRPGMRIDATALALLASVGKTSVLISKQPRVLHLTTGDEIVPPDQLPAEGQIRNSNAALIGALCAEFGVGAATHLHAGDDLASLLRIVDEAKVELFDLILISGGSGQGAYDFSGEIFNHLDATIQFREVNVRPGKPLIFGTIARPTVAQVVFGLPGNALSHFACFHLFVRRAIDHLLDRAVTPPIRAYLTEAMASTMNSRETWWPVAVEFEDGRLECRALPWKSSGDITHLPVANALMKVPASTSRLDAGTMVELLPTRNLDS